MSETPPLLQRYVDAAREQTIVTTSVTADAVLAGLDQHQRHAQARRTLTLSAVIALAASLVGLNLLWPLLSARDAQPQLHAVTPLEDEVVDMADSAGGQLDSQVAAAIDPQVNDLASAISLRTSTVVEVHGPWAIALGEGRHELEVTATPNRALRVSLPDHEYELELVAGTATLEIVDGSAALRLHSGVAAWVGEDGQRSVISVEHVERPTPRPAVSNAQVTASQLAREAELLLAAGKPDKAATVLRKLISAHPKANQTRAALLDLARLLRNAGREDQARCAYELYLQRWPKSSVDSEVRSSLGRLGPGRACRGLDPR